MYINHRLVRRECWGKVRLMYISHRLVRRECCGKVRLMYISHRLVRRQCCGKGWPLYNTMYIEILNRKVEEKEGQSL